MQKNVTVSLDEEILRQAKFSAVKEDMSLSQWFADLAVKTIRKERGFEKAKKRAIQLMNKGFHSGGKPLSREEIYER